MPELAAQLDSIPLTIVTTNETTVLSIGSVDTGDPSPTIVISGNITVGTLGLLAATTTVRVRRDSASGTIIGQPIVIPARVDAIAFAVKDESAVADTVYTYYLTIQISGATTNSTVTEALLKAEAS